MAILKRTQLNASVTHEIDLLRQMKATALRAKYREVFGQESRSSNRQFLFPRVAWRPQVIAEGGLSEGLGEVPGNC
jgi:hypothetical protein